MCTPKHLSAPTPGLPKEKWFFQACSQDRFGGCGTPTVDLFEPYPPYPSCKNPILWLKVDLLADLRGASYPRIPWQLLFYFMYLFIYLFCCFMQGCLYSLSRLSIRELPINNSLDFRGESILTPSPMPPLHSIHPVMVMVAVKLKLSYTLNWTYPPWTLYFKGWQLHAFSP